MAPSCTVKVNVMASLAAATGASLRCWMWALRMMSFAATSVYDEPSVDFSRSPEDSTTVIVIDIRAVSPPSTSVYGKSATA